MKAKNNQTATIFFVVASFLCFIILIITLVLFKDVLKAKAEKQRQLNYYNYQVEQFCKFGDPLITPAPKLK